MALVLNQVVRVRVAVVLGAADASVGQVFDTDTATWSDVVWIDVANSTAQPLEFGDVDFWAEVTNLGLIRTSISHPSVVLRAWAAGGIHPDAFQILTSGSTVQNVAKLLSGGVDVVTTLPALGAVLNTVRIRGLGPQRVGWTGRMPAALSWDRVFLGIRKRVKPGSDVSADSDYLAGVAGFASSHADFSAWLAANRPEYGSAIAIGVSLEFQRSLSQFGEVDQYRYVAVFTVHAFLTSDGSGWSWTARGALMSQTIQMVTASVCGGRDGVQLFYGDAYTPTAPSVAHPGAGAHQGTLNGTFVTPAGAGSVTASPRGILYNGGPTYGVDVSFTADSEGRIIGVTAAGISSDGTVLSVSGWGACKAEGGVLA
ncbi:MAG: hypothetical protein H0X38_02245 [Planctomycetes bacterium]|nr:hypothetical protein [Planctomycetota bacterium]